MTPSVRSQAVPVPDSGAVVAKAVLNAAARLGLPQRALARVVGLSEATVSRMAAGTYVLTPGDKAFELAVLFVRVFRGLDAMMGGDEVIARRWLREPNLALGDAPLALIQSVTGLVQVLAYLDAHRARV